LSNAPDVDAMFADPTHRMRDLDPCMRAAGPEHKLIEVVAGR